MDFRHGYPPDQDGHQSQTSRRSYLKQGIMSKRQLAALIDFASPLFKLSWKRDCRSSFARAALKSASTLQSDCCAMPYRSVEYAPRSCREHDSSNPESAQTLYPHLPSLLILSLHTSVDFIFLVPGGDLPHQLPYEPPVAKTK